MNATPPPDNSLSDRNAVAPLLPILPPREPSPCDREKMKLRLAERVDLPPVIKLLANAKDDLKELNDRLAERTQAFLERERQLLDRLRLAEAALQETVYAEVDVANDFVTYTTLDRRIVGRRTFGGWEWDPAYPLRGQLKISADRPEN